MQFLNPGLGRDFSFIMGKKIEWKGDSLVNPAIKLIQFTIEAMNKQLCFNMNKKDRKWTEFKVIISASRRTDIPAFYAQWFMERVKAGFCMVANPFNRKQVSPVSLRPEDVDVIVFWTKNAEPMLPYLQELNKRGYQYFWHYTINGYPQVLEPRVPAPAKSGEIVRSIADMIGKEKLIWRFDPVMISNLTPPAKIIEQFGSICETVYPFVSHVVISIVDHYRKAVQQFRDLAQKGIHIEDDNEKPGKVMLELIRQLNEIASQFGLSMVSCAEPYDLSGQGVKPGKCIDATYLQRVFGLSVAVAKDPGQRKACGCLPGKDIGVYDTCRHGCAYCYAGTYSGGCKNSVLHDPRHPALLIT